MSSASKLNSIDGVILGGEKQQAQEKKKYCEQGGGDTGPSPASLSVGFAPAVGWQWGHLHPIPMALWDQPGHVLVQEVPGGPQHPCRSHSLGATIQSPPKPVPLASPGTSSSLARGQEPRSHPEVIIFRLHSLKATKSRRVGGSRESRRSNHLHLSDSFMHSFQVSFAEALYQAVQSSPIGSAA